MNQLTFDFFQDTIKHKGLPYIGSKFKYLDQILIHFPEDIHSFYEPFCGGMNLTLNVTAKEFFINDISPMCEIYSLLQSYSIEQGILPFLKKNKIESKEDYLKCH